MSFLDILMQILPYLGAGVGGGGLMWIFNHKGYKRKTEAEIQSAEVDVEQKELQNESAAIANINTVLDRMSGELERYRVDIDKKDEIIHTKTAKLTAVRDELQKKTEQLLERAEDITALRIEITRLEQLICKHEVCPFREPCRFAGKEWWESVKGSEDKITDNESMHEIGRRYGYLVKKMPSKAGKSSKTDISRN